MAKSIVRTALLIITFEQQARSALFLLLAFGYLALWRLDGATFRGGPGSHVTGSANPVQSPPCVGTRGGGVIGYFT